MIGPTMTQLTADQVRHIAKLARLTLSDAEVEKMSKELTSILGYVDQLAEVDTTGVEPTAQATALTGVTREHSLREAPLASPDALLETTPLPIADHQIQTPSAHG